MPSVLVVVAVAMLMLQYNRTLFFIVANRPYLGGTVPIFYAKFPTVPIFLDCIPTFLNSLNVQNSAILFPNLVF